jgi:hypothetical protein
VSALKVTVQCISCKAKRTVAEDEARKLTASHSMPACERCGMVMVARSAAR